jgi:hypothetical protein
MKARDRERDPGKEKVPSRGSGTARSTGGNH